MKSAAEITDQGDDEKVLIQIMAELIGSNRQIAPNGMFRVAAEMELDREFLRRFYKEPFIFKLRLAGQESQSK